MSSLSSIKSCSDNLVSSDSGNGLNISPIFIRPCLDEERNTNSMLKNAYTDNLASERVFASRLDTTLIYPSQIPKPTSP